MSILPTIEINPTDSAIGSVIWLHGLGADGHDFAPIVPELHLDIPLRFVFPHAPLRPVTINNGYVMRAWYYIKSMNIDQRADSEGVAESVSQVQALIAAEEQRGIPADKIVLAGFSQGALIALTTGLAYPKRLAGIMVLSGYLSDPEKTIADAHPANKTTPIFLAHGTEDTVVPYFLGRAIDALLRKNNYPVSWHNYDMPHSVCAEEIRDMGEWLKFRFPVT